MTQREFWIAVQETAYKEISFEVAQVQTLVTAKNCRKNKSGIEVSNWRPRETLSLETFSAKLTNSVTRFGNFATVYFLFGKTMDLLLRIWNIIWLIFIVVNGRISKNNLTIWSHCFQIKRAGGFRGESTCVKHYRIRTGKLVVRA